MSIVILFIILDGGANAAPPGFHVYEGESADAETLFCGNPARKKNVFVVAVVVGVAAVERAGVA